MIEVLTVVLFCWLFFHAVRLTFKITWGVAKVLAVILFVVSLPTLIGCLLFASGVILLIPPGHYCTGMGNTENLRLIRKGIEC